MFKKINQTAIAWRGEDVKKKVRDKRGKVGQQLARVIRRYANGVGKRKFVGKNCEKGKKK